MKVIDPNEIDVVYHVTVFRTTLDLYEQNLNSPDNS
jgi:hypothetical protein